MMSTLSDITLVIPSYNRQRYLLRQISYWQKYDIQVLILDGTKKPSKSLAEPIVKNIRIVHLPESIERRFEHAVGLILTKYAALMSDDEFYLPSSLESIVAFMNQNPEYSTCKGIALWFGFDEKRKQCFGRSGYQGLKGYSIESDNSASRMLDHMNRYEMASLWAVHRSEVLKTCLSLSGKRQAYSSAPAFEIQLSLVCAWYGKIKVLDELMWMRSLENKNIWLSYGNVSTLDWFRSYKYRNETNQFVQDLSLALHANSKDIENAIAGYLESVSLKRKSIPHTLKVKYIVLKYLPESVLKIILKLLKVIKRAPDKPENSLLIESKMLEDKGSKVNLREVQEIESMVNDFHRNHTHAIEPP